MGTCLYTCSSAHVHYYQFVLETLSTVIFYNISLTDAQKMYMTTKGSFIFELAIKNNMIAEYGSVHIPRISSGVH